MRQTEVYEWFIYGLAENMFCVSDTHNKMKKCPRIIGETYGVNREWCVCQGEVCMCAFFPSFFLSVCLDFSHFVLFCLFLYLVEDVYLILMLNQKVIWSPTWLLVGKLCPRNVLTCVCCISHRLLHGRRCIWQGLATTFVGKYFGRWREQSICLCIPAELVSTLAEIQ